MTMTTVVVVVMITMMMILLEYEAVNMMTMVMMVMMVIIAMTTTMTISLYLSDHRFRAVLHRRPECKPKLDAQEDLPWAVRRQRGCSRPLPRPGSAPWRCRNLDRSGVRGLVPPELPPWPLFWERPTQTWLDLQQNIKASKTGCCAAALKVWKAGGWDEWWTWVI